MNQAELYSIEAEKGVLGSILLSPRQAIPKCLQAIDEDCFYGPPHRKIYSVLIDLWNAGRPIDLIIITQELRDKNLLDSVGGVGAVTELQTFVPTAANIDYYLGTLREKRALRQVEAAAKECVKRVHGPMLNVAGILSFAATRFAAIEHYSKNGSVDSGAEKKWGDALNESVVTALELKNLELAPREKLLGDWFCEGDCGFLFAFRGTGKTWLALAMAQALSTGGKLGDWKAPAPVKVLYVDGEMPPDLMRDRCEGLEASNANLQFLNHEILFERTGKVLNIADQEAQRAITARCMNTGVKVLFLDNLSTLASGMKENEADSWELVNPWLLDLRRRKIAVVIVHHAGRSGEMRGTSKREDSVFWIIALDDAKKNADDKRGARFVTRFTKPSRNTQDEIPPYEWHLVTDNANGKITISYEQTQSSEVFMQLITDGVTDCADIADEMKVSKSTVSKWAKKMMDAGRLKKTNRKRYELNDGSEAR
jgi:DnaB-like helicase N terminal domain/AAA domain